MTNNDFIKCPLCSGDGQLHRAEILERLTGRDLSIEIGSWLAEIRKASHEQEPATAATTHEAKVQDFEKEVHSWHPQHPIWRRSQKE